MAIHVTPTTALSLLIQREIKKRDQVATGVFGLKLGGCRKKGVVKRYKGSGRRAG